MSSPQLARSSEGSKRSRDTKNKPGRDVQSRASMTTAPRRPAPLGAPTSPLQRGARLETPARDTTPQRGKARERPGVAQPGTYCLEMGGTPSLAAAGWSRGQVDGLETCRSRGSNPGVDAKIPLGVPDIDFRSEDTLIHNF